MAHPDQGIEKFEDLEEAYFVHFPRGTGELFSVASRPILGSARRW